MWPSDAQREEIIKLARLVDTNIPSRLRPDDFHQVKSDIVYRLRRMARRPEAQ